MLSYILGGKNRITVFLCLLEKPSYAYKIAKKSSKNVSAIYRTLKELSLNGIVVCLNSKARYKKIYCLSKDALLLEPDIRDSKGSNLLEKVSLC